MHLVCKNWMRIERNSSRGLKSVWVGLPATPGHLSWLHCKARAGCKELLTLSIYGKIEQPSCPPQLALWISSIFALSLCLPSVEKLDFVFAPIEPILEYLGNFPKLRHLQLIDPVAPGPLHHRIVAERLTLTSLTVRHAISRSFGLIESL